MSLAPDTTPLAEPVLVTGASGFIGCHLVARLLAGGRRVRAFVLPGEELPPSWGDRVRVHRGDVADRGAVDEAVDGAGTVFHLAAVVQDWGAEALHRRVTIGGTENVLGAVSEVGARAVLASSIVVYGRHLRDRLCDEDVPMGESLGPYSRSKQAQERIARRLQESDGLRLTVVRPANVFGPGSRPWVHEVLRLLRSRGLSLIGGGAHNAGLCHVENLVDVLILAASLEVAEGRTYNASDGSDVTWKRYFTDLARLAGTAPPRSAPASLAVPLALLLETVWKLGVFRNRPPITREALNLVQARHGIPVERARRELGYAPRISYDQALEDLAPCVASPADG